MTKGYSQGGMSDSFEIGEYKGSKSILSKFDNDLFNENDDKVEKVFSVKRTESRTRGERWKILADDEIILIIEGNKISKKDSIYLRSANGFNFLIDCIKKNIRSVNAIKKELKNKRNE
jgi:hypothetical protein